MKTIVLIALLVVCDCVWLKETCLSSFFQGALTGTAQADTTLYPPSYYALETLYQLNNQFLTILPDYLSVKNKLELLIQATEAALAQSITPSKKTKPGEYLKIFWDNCWLKIYILNLSCSFDDCDKRWV